MSKTMCSLSRALLLLELLVGGAATAATTTVLVASRIRSGVWAGPGTTTETLIERAAQWLVRQTTMHGAAIAAIAAGVAILALVLLVLSVRSAVQRAPRLILSSGSLGVVAVDLKQVGLLAQHEAERVQGVREVDTTAESDKSGLAIQQTIAIEPEMAFASLAEQVQQRVKQSLEFHLGLPVMRVQVLLRHTNMSKGPI